MPDEHIDRQTENTPQSEKLADAGLPEAVKLTLDEADTLRTENLELTKEVERLRTLVSDQEVTVSALAHDLKAPVRFVVGATGFLIEDHAEALGEKGMEWLEGIARCGKNLQSLVIDFLNYQQLTIPTPVECDLTELVEATITLDGIREDDSVTVDYQGLATVTADKKQLRIVLSNLVNNAIKYRDEARNPEIQITSAETDTHWQISVSDNGVGIPEKHLEAVFDFTRRLHSHTDIEGQGIGLAACKKIVALHNGEIWVDSEVGTGSSFHFTLRKPQ